MDKIGRLVRSRLEQKPNYRLHSELHALADEISAYFGERGRFAMYLGAIKRVGLARARVIFSEVKQSDARNPRKLFFWKTKTPADAAVKPAKRPLPQRRKAGKLSDRRKQSQMKLWPSERS